METLVGGASSILSTVMSPGVRTNATYGRLPEDRPVSTAVHLRWDAHAVGEWLIQLGLGEHRDAFVRHKISGDLLECLEKEDLRELGVNLVGNRLLLMREVARLRNVSAGRERGRMIWEAEEVVHRDGVVGYLQHYLLCHGWWRGRGRYTLTGSSLVIFSYSENTRPCLCCAEASAMRTIELSSIAGVTAHSAIPTCVDCGLTADTVHIDLNQELGLAPVPPLAVQAGSGGQVAQLILDAVGHTAPSPQTLVRSASNSALGWH